MSGVGLDLGHDDQRTGRKRRRGPGCIIAAVVVALVCGAAYIGLSKGADALSDWLGPPEDYHGQGTGSVRVHVAEGDSAAAIGQTLKHKGAVASVDAFIDAATDNASARSIQPGFYQLHKKMSANAALKALLDPDNRVEGTVTIPEGARVGQVVEAVAEHTHLSEKDLTRALRKPGRLGLPAAAHGNPEGYLFPATYTVKPDTKAVDLLREMVAKARRVDRELNIGDRAHALGISREDAVTVASIIEREARRDRDRPKVARVIYNRLEDRMALQMDSTVTYISNRSGDPWTTKTERNADSAYNTYKHVGLPPGPIGSPGRETLEAALNPAHGNWRYFVTTNFKTGKTVFTHSYKEHLRNVKESKRYCRQSKLC